MSLPVSIKEKKVHTYNTNFTIQIVLNCTVLEVKFLVFAILYLSVRSVVQIFNFVIIFANFAFDQFIFDYV